MSRHAVVIAAIFIPYFLLMVTLGTYIWHTGHHRSEEDDSEGLKPAGLPATARRPATAIPSRLTRLTRHNQEIP
jgi:hypothetical protein